MTPWEKYGGSLVWRDERYPGGRVTLPRRCCPNTKPKLVGDCGEGCCEDFECESCGKKWRYEYPD
jgi:hypothetical protein